MQAAMTNRIISFSAIVYLKNLLFDSNHKLTLFLANLEKNPVTQNRIQPSYETSARISLKLKLNHNEIS